MEGQDSQAREDENAWRVLGGSLGWVRFPRPGCSGAAGSFQEAGTVRVLSRRGLGARGWLSKIRGQLGTWRVRCGWWRLAPFEGT